jgi:uncharacterized protein (DUF1501 family)
LNNLAISLETAMSDWSGRPSLTRREWLTLAGAGVLGPSFSGWLPILANRAAAAESPGKKRKSCILLWMDGGPSPHETFDLKPEAPAEVRGEFKPIDTSVVGLQISERLPQVAKVMHHAAVLRGMSTSDNNHLSARVHMHTGFKQGGGVEYPTLGSLVSSEIGDRESVLPNFVVTGIPTYDSVKFPLVTSPGHLGPAHAPLVISDLRKGVENLQPLMDADDLKDRLTVLEKLQESFLRRSEAAAAEAQQTTLRQAVQLMRSPAAQAFDLRQEPESSRKPYGDSYFGQGCLLARRLVEVGVPFVEVYLPDWDTHFKERVDRNWKQSLPQLDTGLSALVADLKQRGLLDDTLVVWMGEFGRTPKINNRAGRDHYSKAWTTVLFGGGVKAGLTIGKTDAQGATVTDRPISIGDFMATICRVLGIDYTKEITVRDRPLHIVEKGAKPIQELFGS